MYLPIVCNFHTQDNETVKQDLSEELLIEQTLQHTTIYIAKQIFPLFCIPQGTFIITSYIPRCTLKYSHCAPCGPPCWLNSKTPCCISVIQVCKSKFTENRYENDLCVLRMLTLHRDVQQHTRQTTLSRKTRDCMERMQ